MPKTSLIAVLAVSAAALACKKDEAPTTPVIAASAVVPSAVEAGPTSVKYVLDPAGKTMIDMPAPKEHIRADTSAAAGELVVDPANLGRTRGQVKADLFTLTTRTFGDADKDKAQTKHAHNWLEAGELVTAEVREANRWVIFTIRSVEGLSAGNLSSVATAPGPSDETRTVSATAKGDFFLHGHQVPKDVSVDVVFHYPTGTATKPWSQPTSVEIRTKTPLHVVLAEHDVKPRDEFGKLAQASFSLLGTKVAESADISFDLTASKAAP